MDALNTLVSFNKGIEEIAFVLSLGLISFFYTAYKKCEEEAEKEEMLDHFLKE
jgi:hypothetical protein